MKLLVFTDLDGTLLDHATYSFQPAMPALTALRTRQIPLILASSKTGAEMAQIHAQLGLGDTPAIVENGADILVPGQGAGTTHSYATIRHRLSTLPPELRQCFTGFGDMSDADIADATGLPLVAAQNARKRCFSEPGLWSGTDAQLQEFLSVLKKDGIHARRGGRFLTLSLGGTKADQMRQIIAQYQADVTIALGDAPNDVEMLEAADIGVVIHNDHSPRLPQLAGEADGKIRRSRLPGPAGWNEEIMDILNNIPQQES
ncbi:mannosyl-3-phosphoglycerate phosphatase [Thioclava sp. SK-1]|uniref:HAD-IIB family hydrolase n=1 Tax=Thioclava sp. SK-1 TaxID=1889770 RepID=UPI0008259E48|nr:HAD-IIB family hydrolase [Thioclava sp. SK-1]OCX63426.1 mannosyl-3-phosphoglycerate phosphatase [Thioclava sp. SK-1]